MVALPGPRDAEALLPPAEDEGHLAATSRWDSEAEDGPVVQDGCRMEHESRRCE